MNHYHRPRLFETIKEKLTEAGFNLEKLTRQDIGMVDEFHLQGAQISERLAAKLDLTPDLKVLDVGCGIGGPARMIAAQFGCQVSGIDYTEEYVRTANELSVLVGLDHLTAFAQGDATSLPISDTSFDAVWTQHAQMNISEKATLYQEIDRVLKPGGRFLYYDIFAGPRDGLTFPVPWAETPDYSFLMPHAKISTYFGPDRWQMIFEEDHIDNAVHALNGILTKIQSGDAPKVGLNLLMGPSTFTKLSNLHQGLIAKQVSVYAGCYQKKVKN